MSRFKSKPYRMHYCVRCKEMTEHLIHDNRPSVWADWSEFFDPNEQWAVYQRTRYCSKCNPSGEARPSDNGKDSGPFMTVEVYAADFERLVQDRKEMRSAIRDLRAQLSECQRELASLRGCMAEVKDRIESFEAVGQKL